MSVKEGFPYDWHDGILMSMNAVFPQRRDEYGNVTLELLLYELPEDAQRKQYRVMFSKVTRLQFTASVCDLADNAGAGNIEKYVHLPQQDGQIVWIYLMEGVVEMHCEDMCLADV